ncbi:hypothetical protein PAPHI01_2681 [Pancytospora philotis]|nr:hypothetical protein PAPHI01_2681 [Pancytospora philotis]
MVVHSCGTLASALWAFVGLASASSDRYTELRNGTDYGYSGSSELDSVTTVQEVSDGVFRVDKALIKLAATGSGADHHEAVGIKLHESETDGPTDWDAGHTLAFGKYFKEGSIEFYTEHTVTLKTGYWYSIAFHTPRIEGYNRVVFIKPWQCPDLRPHAKAKPAGKVSAEYYYIYHLLAIPVIIIAVALCCYAINRCCFGSSKQGPGTVDG